MQMFLMLKGYDNYFHKYVLFMMLRAGGLGPPARSVFPASSVSVRYFDKCYNLF